MIVAGRLAYVNHILAADAFYHHQCSYSFWTGGGGGEGGGWAVLGDWADAQPHRADIHNKNKPIIGRPELVPHI